MSGEMMFLVDDDPARLISGRDALEEFAEIDKRAAILAAAQNGQWDGNIYTAELLGPEEEKAVPGNSDEIIDAQNKMAAMRAEMEQELSVANAKLKDALEQATAASRAKSDFLAKMSHEIRTPMNAITGMAELALRETMPPAVREHVLTIKRASSDLLSIINDILDFSKIESGKLEIIPAEYRLASLINDVVSIIKAKGIAPELSFEVNVDGKIPNALFGDALRIKQALLNVLSNAVKYTKEGFISLTVDGEIKDDDTALLTIKVADSGKGIKLEDMKKLFIDFTRLDHNRNKGIEGTGLGLTITKDLVTAMGGEIGVKSVYGKGSTFTIKLPQKICSRAPISAAAADSPAEGLKDDIAITFNAPAARILVVDDISTNLKVAAGLLSPYKMQVDLASSGAEAVEMIKSYQYDMIFMDHMMPEMDGIEAVKIIRGLGGEGERFTTVPIVALTANAISGVMDMFLQNGFNDFLSKPIDTAELDAVMKKWIPEEKQTAAADETCAGRDTDTGIVIEGVDVNLGIKRTGGTAANYLRTLAIFGKDTAKKISEIKKCLETNDIPLFITHIHGLKSAAAIIGAESLSKKAEELEAAGKHSDTAFIESRAPRLLAGLERLLRGIEKTVEPGRNSLVMDNSDTKALNAALSTLLAAVKGLDHGTVKAAVKYLHRFENAAGIGNTVEDILQKVLTGEYDEAAALIEPLLPPSW
jgi:signal transduction histidine kinase/FixJ family two-component response regulator/HPt (histidine-containing phosphotransfer) domain-containing protein